MSYVNQTKITIVVVAHGFFRDNSNFVSKSFPFLYLFTKVEIQCIFCGSCTPTHLDDVMSNCKNKTFFYIFSAVAAVAVKNNKKLKKAIYLVKKRCYKLIEGIFRIRDVKLMNIKR